MNWYSNVVPPKIKAILKREAPENLWVKCPESGQLVFHKDIAANLYVVPGSGYHMRCPVATRLASLFDNGECDLLPTPETPLDPLKFRDIKRYVDKLKEYRTKTGMNDAVVLAFGKLADAPVTVAVQDFDFLGGSLGMAAGEAIVAAADYALSKRTPFIIFTASGGARMQEGILSLMQMPRTTVAVQMLKEANLPYIVVLTHPTTGGVTASYAMMGDVQIAEPNALICFAGPRVIEQTVREKLPEGFQRAEFLLEKGALDQIVDRRQLRETVARLLALLQRQGADAVA